MKLADHLNKKNLVILNVKHTEAHLFLEEATLANYGTD